MQQASGTSACAPSGNEDGTAADKPKSINDQNKITVYLPDTDGNVCNSNCSVEQPSRAAECSDGHNNDVNLKKTVNQNNKSQKQKSEKDPKGSGPVEPPSGWKQQSNSVSSSTAMGLPTRAQSSIHQEANSDFHALSGLSGDSGSVSSSQTPLESPSDPRDCFSSKESMVYNNAVSRSEASPYQIPKGLDSRCADTPIIPLAADQRAMIATFKYPNAADLNLPAGWGADGRPFAPDMFVKGRNFIFGNRFAYPTHPDMVGATCLSVSMGLPVEDQSNGRSSSNPPALGGNVIPGVGNQHYPQYSPKARPGYAPPQFPPNPCADQKAPLSSISHAALNEQSSFANIGGVSNGMPVKSSQYEKLNPNCRMQDSARFVPNHTISENNINNSIQHGMRTGSDSDSYFCAQGAKRHQLGRANGLNAMGNNGLNTTLPGPPTTRRPGDPRASGDQQYGNSVSYNMDPNLPVNAGSRTNFVQLPQKQRSGGTRDTGIPMNMPRGKPEGPPGRLLDNNAPAVSQFGMDISFAANNGKQFAQRNLPETYPVWREGYSMSVPAFANRRLQSEAQKPVTVAPHPLLQGLTEEVFSDMFLRIIIQNLERKTMDVVEVIRPSGEESDGKNKLFSRLKKFLTMTFKDRLQIILAGSTAYEADTKGSDIDVVLLSPPESSVLLLRTVNNYLNMNSRDFDLEDVQVEFIESARVPILAIKAPMASCDVSVNTHNSIAHTQFFKAILQRHESLNQVMRLVKFWTTSRKLPQMKDGGLPGIVWMLVTVFFTLAPYDMKSIHATWFECSDKNNEKNQPAGPDRIFCSAVRSTITRLGELLDPTEGSSTSIISYLMRFFFLLGTRTLLTRTLSVSQASCAPKNLQEVAERVCALNNRGVWDEVVTVEDPALCPFVNLFDITTGSRSAFDPDLYTAASFMLKDVPLLDFNSPAASHQSFLDREVLKPYNVQAIIDMCQKLKSDKLRSIRGANGGSRDDPAGASRAGDSSSSSDPGCADSETGESLSPGVIGGADRPRAKENPPLSLTTITNTLALGDPYFDSSNDLASKISSATWLVYLLELKRGALVMMSMMKDIGIMSFLLSHGPQPQNWVWVEDKPIAESATFTELLTGSVAKQHSATAATWLSNRLCRWLLKLFQENSGDRYVLPGQQDVIYASRRNPLATEDMDWRLDNEDSICSFIRMSHSKRQAFRKSIVYALEIPLSNLFLAPSSAFRNHDYFRSHLPSALISPPPPARTAAQPLPLTELDYCDDMLPLCCCCTISSTEFAVVLLEGTLHVVRLMASCVDFSTWWAKDFLSRRDVRSVVHGQLYKFISPAQVLDMLTEDCFDPPLDLTPESPVISFEHLRLPPAQFPLNPTPVYFPDKSSPDQNSDNKVATEVKLSSSKDDSPSTSCFQASRSSTASQTLMTVMQKMTPQKGSLPAPVKLCTPALLVPANVNNKFESPPQHVLLNPSNFVCRLRTYQIPPPSVTPEQALEIQDAFWLSPLEYSLVEELLDLARQSPYYRGGGDVDDVLSASLKRHDSVDKSHVGGSVVRCHSSKVATQGSGRSSRVVPSDKNAENSSGGMSRSLSSPSMHDAVPSSNAAEIMQPCVPQCYCGQIGIKNIKQFWQSWHEKENDAIRNELVAAHRLETAPGSAQLNSRPVSGPGASCRTRTRLAVDIWRRHSLKSVTRHGIWKRRRLLIEKLGCPLCCPVVDQGVNEDPDRWKFCCAAHQTRGNAMWSSVSPTISSERFRLRHLMMYTNNIPREINEYATGNNLLLPEGPPNMTQGTQTTANQHQPNNNNNNNNYNNNNNVRMRLQDLEISSLVEMAQSCHSFKWRNGIVAPQSAPAELVVVPNAPPAVEPEKVIPPAIIPSDQKDVGSKKDKAKPIVQPPTEMVRQSSKSIQQSTSNTSSSTNNLSTGSSSSEVPNNNNNVNDNRVDFPEPPPPEIVTKQPIPGSASYSQTLLLHSCSGSSNGSREKKTSSESKRHHSFSSGPSGAPLPSQVEVGTSTPHVDEKSVSNHSAKRAAKVTAANPRQYEMMKHLITHGEAPSWRGGTPSKTYGDKSLSLIYGAESDVGFPTAVQLPEERSVENLPLTDRNASENDILDFRTGESEDVLIPTSVTRSKDNNKERPKDKETVPVETKDKQCGPDPKLRSRDKKQSKDKNDNRQPNISEAVTSESHTTAAETKPSPYLFHAKDSQKAPCWQPLPSASNSDEGLDDISVSSGVQMPSYTSSTVGLCVSGSPNASGPSDFLCQSTPKRQHRNPIINASPGSSRIFQRALADVKLPSQT